MWLLAFAPSFLGHPSSLWKYKHRKLQISPQVHLVGLFPILERKESVIWPFFVFLFCFRNHKKTEPQPRIFTPNRTTNHGEDYCWYNLAPLLLSRVCENVHKASTLFWPIYNEIPPSQNASCFCFFLHPFHQTLFFFFFFFFRSVAHRSTKLPVTCMTCSSAPSACWRSPVRFSSRSSLCEEFGRWWGCTAEWRVLERRLPGWSDRTNWSLALQDRDSQTLSQNWSSKCLKCFHPCVCVAVGCMLFLHHLVWEWKVEMRSQTHQQ